MIRMSVSTRISLEDPSPDLGFVTWFDVEIHRYPSPDDDGGAGGDDLDAGDEGVEQIGRAEIAIVHVGAILESHDSLYDVLDADSGDLEALYHVYFDRQWFKDEYGGSAGVDLGYLQELTIDPAWQDRNIEFAIVQRLNDTLAAGCKVLVMPVGTREEVARWAPMGFEVPASEKSDPGHVHLNNERRHPRVMEHPHQDDRFEVLRTEANDDEEPKKAAPDSPAMPAPPAPGASPSSPVRRPTTWRAPSRRRR